MPRPLNIERERAAATPRSRLEDPTRFGIDATAQWRAIDDLPIEESAAVIRAYWQHLAACAVREHFGQRSLAGVAMALHEVMKAYSLSGETVRGSEHLQRLLSGALVAPVDQIIFWTLATRDVSVLPSPESFAELFPPGALRKRQA